MPNPRHVEIVRHGAASIRVWRRTNPGVRPDLSGVDLSKAKLRGADLRGADLCGADLRGLDFRAAKLNAAKLRDANLSGASLTKASRPRRFSQGLADRRLTRYRAN